MNKQAAKYKISPKGKRKLDYPTKRSSKAGVKLPLIGKTIYLDVKDGKHLKTLQQDLKKLGATLEEFVSRDINYLITSQPRPRNKVTSPCGDENPSPSPFNCDPSPSPGYPEDKKVTSVTRGKALAEKARYTRQTSTLLDNAEKWGVKIVSIEGAFKWIDKELKKLPKSVGNQSKKSNRTKCVSSYKLIKAPYVKLEGKTFCYRPFHLELDVWPRLNVDTPRGSCPFDGTQIKGGDESREERGELLAAQVDIPSEDTPKEEKDGSESAVSTPKPSADKTGKKSDSDVFGGSRIMTAGELKRRKDLKRKQERKRGYCECCHVKYEDLDKHVKEDQHRQYVKNKSNYQQLDTMITSGRNTQHFLYEYLTKAAHITSMRNSNSSSSNKKVIDDTIRRSPRKSVQEVTIKSLIRSPRKTIQQPTVQLARSPQISAETPAQTVRASPRKNLQKLTDDENLAPQPKIPVTNAVLSKLSPTGRTRRNSESKKKAEGSPNPDVNVSVTGNTGAAGSRTQNTRKQHLNLQKENGILRECENDVDNCQNIRDAVNEIRKESESACPSSLKKDREKSPEKTLSPMNKVLCKSPMKNCKSPMKKESKPRKQLSKCIVQCNDVSSNDANEVLNKENVSPLKHKDEKKVGQKPGHNENIREMENYNENKVTDNQIDNELTSRSRKCRQRSVCSEKAVEDLVGKFNEETVNVCDKSVDILVDHSAMDESSEAMYMDYESIKAGFTEIVNCGRRRSRVEHSSDDFEVCFARSLENEALPDFNKTDKKTPEKTFDGMVVQCEKIQVINESNDTFSVHKACLTENKTDGNKHKARKSPFKKHKNTALLNKSGSRVKVPLEQMEKNSNKDKDTNNAEKDVFDIDEQSDIPSDFQCYDKRGKLLTFSKTLAERIKERSVGRRSSVESYNMNVLFQLPSRSRSNSFSSNHSETTFKTVTETKSKNCLKKIERKKSGSSIASAKVVNKYRNRRIGLKQDDSNTTGYQGDDENERTPMASNLTQSRVCQKKQRKKFWHYEPVNENAGKEIDKELKGLPKELRELKAGYAWFSSDNSDSEPRRARLQVNRNESTESKRINSLNKKDKFIKDTVLPLEETESMQQALNESSETREMKKDSDKNIKGRRKNKEACTKKKKFWYYVTERTESDSEKDIETDMNIPRELHKLRNQTECCRAKKNTNTIDDHSSTVVNKSLQRNKSEKEECRANEEVTRESATSRKGKGKSMSGLKESSIDSCDDTKKIESKSRKKEHKYWNFVEEAVDVEIERENQILKNLPKELRELKDAWTTGQILNKNDRRKSKILYKDEETEESSSGEELDQDKQVEAVKEKLGNMCENDSLNASEGKETLNTKKNCKRYWDVVVVKEYIDEEGDRDLPKELRDLKFSKSDIFGSRASDIQKRLRIRNKKIGVSSYLQKPEFGVNDEACAYTGVGINLRRRETRVDYCESDNPETELDEKESEDEDGRGEKNKSDKISRELRERKQMTKVNYRESDETETESYDCHEVETYDKSFKNQCESSQGYVNVTEGSSDRYNRNNTCRKEGKSSSKKIAGHIVIKQKNERRKFYDKVIEAIDETSDKSEHANVPKELRLLKKTCVSSSRNDTDRRSRSNSRRNDFEDNAAPEILSSNNKSETRDSGVNKSIGPCHNNGKRGNLDEENLEMSSEKRTNGNEIDNLEYSDSEPSRSKSRKRKVFWEYKAVPVEENTSTVDKTLPKQLQLLRDTWNYLSDSNGTDRKSRSTIRRNEESAASELSKNKTETVDSVEPQVNKREYSDHVTGKLNDTNEVDIEMNSEKVANGNRLDNMENSDIERSRSKSRKRKVFWEYKDVPLEGNTVTVDKTLPKELQLLKDTWNYLSDSNGTDRKSRSTIRGKDHEESAASEILRSKNKIETVGSIAFGSVEPQINKSEYSDKPIGKPNDTNMVNFEINSRKVANVNEIDNMENSDSERSRSKSRKRKVFWEYKDVPLEENSVTVDKSLPKELQLLKDTWNDFSGSKGRRSRSCQSQSDVSDVEIKNKTVYKTTNKTVRQNNVDNDSDDEEVVLIEEVSVATKSKAKVMPEKKQEANTRNCDETKSLTESGSAQKDDRVNETPPYGEMMEEANARSTSPVFNVIQNPRHKVQRRKSPVFNRSPRQFAESDENRKKTHAGSRKVHKMNTKKYSYIVKGRNVKRNISSKIHKRTHQKRTDQSGSCNVHSEDYCSDSEEEVGRNGTGTKLLTVSTPEKSIPALEPVSGYSNTPREKRRKQWKRKKMESDSGCQDGKRRRLEHGNVVDDSRVTLVNKSTPRRRLLEQDDDGSNTEITDKTDSNQIKQRTEHAGHENMEDKFALAWKPVGSDTGENKCDKVKLNKSWTMLSERSVSKLLSSEDENENFDGFTDEDTLPSDMSYEERSEVVIPKDDKHEWVLEDEENSENEENLVQYVPVFFPSPNKTSNSSWNDAIEGYIDNSVKHGPDSSFPGEGSAYFSFSPRKSPLKRSCMSPCKTSGFVKTSKLQSPVKVHRPCTPKKKTNIIMHSPEVERVDNEIEFNFGSPQKNRSDFSPLRTVNGVVKKSLSCTANLTSTPVSKNSKKHKHRRH